jgi:hypothetical protein
MDHVYFVVAVYSLLPLLDCLYLKLFMLLFLLLLLPSIIEGRDGVTVYWNKTAFLGSRGSYAYIYFVTNFAILLTPLSNVLECSRDMLRDWFGDILSKILVHKTA